MEVTFPLNELVQTVVMDNRHCSPLASGFTALQFWRVGVETEAEPVLPEGIKKCSRPLFLDGYIFSCALALPFVWVPLYPCLFGRTHSNTV